MNSKNSQTSEPHRLFLNLSDKINLKRNDNYVALLNLSMYDMWKNIKNRTKTINLKYKDQLGIKNLPDGSYSVSNIQHYFEYIIKNKKK